MNVSTGCRTELLQRLTKSLRDVGTDTKRATATLKRHQLLKDALPNGGDDLESASRAVRAWLDGVQSLLDSKNVSHSSRRL